MLQKTILKNKLHILSHRVNGFKSICIHILVKVGSRYEKEHEQGICHFLEHMAFKGTKTKSYKQIAEDFDKIGGRFNAYTSREHTCYYVKVLSEHTELAIEMLHDILQNSVYSSVEIEKERQVIFQEMAEAEDSPDDLNYDSFIETAFQNQALGRSIFGTKESLEKFNSNCFLDYVKNNYHGKNMIISAAGDIEHDYLVKVTEKFFSSMHENDTSSFEKAFYTPGYKYIKKDLEQVNLLIGFEGVSKANKLQLYKSQMLSLIFGGSISSRLFQNIREKQGLAYSVGAFNNSYVDIGLFCIQASTTIDNFEKLLKGLQDEISKICDSISHEELERSKQQSKANIIMASENPSYKSEEIASSFAIFNEYTSEEETIEQINSFSTSDLNQIASEIFSSKTTICGVGPKLNFEEIINKTIL